jgi:pimeloyl-ACP methyl ester carboxylesterase
VICKFIKRIDSFKPSNNQKKKNFEEKIYNIWMAVRNIVLVHGWGANTSKLQPLAINLEKHSWKVFLPKLPGFDITPPEKPWFVADFANYVSAEAKRYFNNQEFVVFGHSFGGRIAMKMALTDDKVDGLVLCATSGVSRGKLAKRAVFKAMSRLGMVISEFPKLSAFWRKVIYKLAREHDYEKASGVMKETFKNIIEEDSKKFVHEIKIPTLIFWGDKDKMTPLRDAHFLEKNIKKSKLIVFNGIGHRLPYLLVEDLAKEISKWAK